MPEGRNGKGWKSFLSELRVVVKYTQSIYGAGNNNSMLEQKSMAEVGLKKRLFVEVMMHMRPTAFDAFCEGGIEGATASKAKDETNNEAFESWQRRQQMSRNLWQRHTC